MSIWERLNEIDIKLFLFFNGKNNLFFDHVMSVLTYKWTWIPLYSFLLYIMYMKRKSNFSFFIFILLLIPFGIYCSDQLSSFFKNVLVRRPRPCHYQTIAQMVHTVNNKCGGKFGFYSAHASNSFFIAAVFTGIIRNRFGLLSLFFWAAVVSWSRVYLGVHFLGDIVVGAVFGILIAKLILVANKFIVTNVKK